MKNLFALFMLAACVSLASAADWKMERAGSRLEFAATFEKVAAPGVFKEFDVRMSFDSDSPAGGHLDVSISVPSADMASADIDTAIAGAAWFDFAQHQRAEFHATYIHRLQTNPPSEHYVARGTLTLKGVAQPLEVPFTWNAAGEGATMEGAFSVKRGSFGIGTGEWTATDVIGPDVAVRFSVRLRKSS